MKRDDKFDLLESLNNLDDDILTDYTAARASLADGAPGAAGQPERSKRERSTSPWVTAACICLFAVLVYIAVLLTAGGGWDRIAAGFGWGTSQSTNHETEYPSDPEDTPGTQAETEQSTNGPDSTITFPTDAPEDGDDVLFADYNFAIRWGDRVISNALLLTSDRYPYNGKIIDSKTGTITPICRDPFCAHKAELLVGDPAESCPFNAAGNIYFVHENKLYYTRMYYVVSKNDANLFDYHKVFASYDLMDGTYHELYSIIVPNIAGHTDPERYEADSFGKVIRYGNAAYLIVWLPITEDPESMEDYRQTLIRFDLTTEKMEKVLDVQDKMSAGDILMCIRERKCWVLNLTEHSIKTLNMETGEVRTVYHTSDETHIMPQAGVGLWRNWLYLLLWDETTGQTRVIRYNASTGEEQLICDAGVNAVFVGNGYVYCGLQNSRQEGTIWQDFAWQDESNPFADMSIIRYDLDGTNMCVIGVTTAMINTLMPDGLYGFGFRFDPETGITSDLETGAVEIDSTAYLARMKALGYQVAE